MKPLRLVLGLALTTAVLLPFGIPAQSQQGAPSGISMSFYPVERGSDGLQYLVTPAGHKVHVPGMGIAQNAKQVPVYRDQKNNFWYADTKGQPVAVTPQQLDFVQAQMNAQAGGGGRPVQSQAPAAPGNYYRSNPQYAGGYNGVPYATPMTMEGQGQYSYMAPGGAKQYVKPTPQTSAHFDQWEQQESRDRDTDRISNVRDDRIDRRTGRRADRIENRAGRGYDNERRSNRQDRRLERQDRRAGY